MVIGLQLQMGLGREVLQSTLSNGWRLIFVYVSVLVITGWDCHLFEDAFGLEKRDLDIGLVVICVLSRGLDTWFIQSVVNCGTELLFQLLDGVIYR